MNKFKKTGIIRASALLTDSYVAGTEVHVPDHSQATICISYAMGAAETSNAVLFKIEYSPDLAKTDYYQESMMGYDTVTAGSSTTSTIQTVEHSFQAEAAASSATNFVYEVPFCSSWIKVSFKESGVAANYGTCSCEYYIGWS